MGDVVTRPTANAFGWLRGDGVDLADGPFDVGSIPMDAVAMVAYREFLVCRVYEWRHAAHDPFAWNLPKQLVAGRASREGETVWIEWVARHHLANLIAEEMAFDIQDVWRRAQPLITCEQRAPFHSGKLQDLGAGKRRVAKHVSSHQPQPAREPEEHTVGGKFRGVVHGLSSIPHLAGYNIGKHHEALAAEFCSNPTGEGNQ